MRAVNESKGKAWSLGTNSRLPFVSRISLYVTTTFTAKPSSSLFFPLGKLWSCNRRHESEQDRVAKRFSVTREGSLPASQTV